MRPLISREARSDGEITCSRQTRLQLLKGLLYSVPGAAGAADILPEEPEKMWPAG